jgi:hypothetical protein
VCFECVDDEFLRAEIEKGGHDGTCFYCEQDGKTFSIDQMAHLVDTALSEFFCRTATEPPDPAHVPKTGWRREGQPVAEVISRSAGIGEAAAEDIRQVLAERHDEMERGRAGSEEAPFDHDAHYGKKQSVDAWDFEGGWLLFEESLKTWIRRIRKAARSLERSADTGLSAWSGLRDNLTFGEVIAECAIRPEIFESPVITGV